MRKQIYLTGLIIIFFYSCTPQLKKEVTETFDDGSPKIVLYFSQDNPKEILKKTTFYENSQLRLLGFFQDNKKHGKWMYFYENGNKMAEVHFKKGKKEGMSTRWNENGSLHSSGSYRKDLRSGKWFFYDNEGLLVNQQNFN